MDLIFNSEKTNKDKNDVSKPKEFGLQKYIKISKTDFSRKITRSRSLDSHFRSLEAYLIKNNFKYHIG